MNRCDLTATDPWSLMLVIRKQQGQLDIITHDGAKATLLHTGRYLSFFFFFLKILGRHKSQSPKSGMNCSGTSFKRRGKWKGGMNTSALFY